MPSRGRTQPPSSPVPDYDSREKSVEVTSLDSLSLVDPPTDPPQPPKTYFDDRRPIVSINAYSARPSPNRLDFLPSQKQLQQQQQDTLSEDYRVKLNRFDRAAEDLRFELTETLSRANLRNRSSSVENLLEESRNGEHPDPLKKPISTLTKGCTSASNLADSTDWAVSANGTPPANGTANGSVAALASRFEPSRGTSVTYNFQKTGPVVSRDEDNRVTIAVKCTPRNGMSTVNSILKLKPSQRPTALSKTISFDDT
ncbi:unnamed protein product [Darwinula stevensoni]|uniref:Uncharacterized protein n=1 Tax=Darwinula stevensoni TaxID=69355 RepID=A0A7R8X986_9CRUS|nr:unnamed protein product [Darwinula stevensoni]CAG0888911.1 unnamed protein product [Darwinula stevensoni]